MVEHKSQVYLPDAAVVENIQLRWWRTGGALEVVPVAAIHARGRRDYYSFGAAVVAMKDGVMNAAPCTLSYLRGDHPSTLLRTGLGSVSLTTNKSGQKVSERPSAGSGQAATSQAPVPSASERANCAGVAARACRPTLRQTGLPVRSGQASRSLFDFAQGKQRAGSSGTNLSAQPREADTFWPFHPHPQQFSRLPAATCV